MTQQDQVFRFSFDQLDLRGELVYLNHSFEQVLERHEYPPAVRHQLGTALAAVALLSVTIKFAGTLILQIQGKGPLQSLVAQISHEGDLRGLARWQGLVPEGTLQEVYGDGRMLITILKDGGDRYQSIVDLAGDSLSEALNRYFEQSEQLPSSFRLHVRDQQVGGLFLQALPLASQPRATRLYPPRDREEDWNRINLLADTLSADEIFSLPPERLLFNLFHEEEVRLHEPHALRFACTCSRAKVERTLITMGRDELDDIIATEGSIEVDCEFCNQHYHFDRAAVDKLYDEDAGPTSGTILH
jgi:molecular chaperone Hsp33